MAQPVESNFTDRTAEARAHEAALGGILARYTVALVPDDQLKIGTGVLVSFGADLFIATARHLVLDELQGDVYCLPKPAGPTKILEKADVPEMLQRGLIGLGERFRLQLKDRMLSNDDSDVALLRLAHRATELNEMEFYPLETAHSNRTAHPHVIVCGYPFDLTLVDVSARHAAAFSRPVHGTLSAIEDAEYVPDRDLVIAYKKFEGPLAAAGMSGGGVWSPPIIPKPGDGRPWDPRNLTLLGIQVAQFPESRAPGRPLLGTRIERVKALLAV